MIFDDKVEILNYVQIAGDFTPKGEKVLQIINSKFQEETILYKINTKKTNNYGWTNQRQIYITDQRLINTDDKCSLISYMQLVFVDFVSNKVIVLNKQHVDNTQKYHFEFQESASTFVKYLQILGISKNNHLKFYQVIGQKIIFNDIFFNGVTPEKMDDFMLDHQIKQLNFPEKVEYLIDKQNFLKDRIANTTLLFKDKNYEFDIENYKIIEILENKDYVTVFLLYNSVTYSYSVLKLYKKWRLAKNSQRESYYKQMFEHFQNNENTINIYQISEDQIFLYILCEYMPYGNIYNFIYKEFDKNTLNESEPTIQKANQKNQCLFCLQPENIYFDVNNNFKLSHITKEKLVQEEQDERDIEINIEYCPPFLFKDNLLDSQVDYWQLGILLYECLYGVTPFQQDSQQETKNLILDSNFFYPKTSKKISNELKSFINLLLLKNYDQRIQQITTETILNHEWVQVQNQKQPELNLQKIKDKITVKMKTKKSEKYFKDYIAF